MYPPEKSKKLCSFCGPLSRGIAATIFFFIIRRILKREQIEGGRFAVVGKSEKQKQFFFFDKFVGAV